MSATKKVLLLWAAIDVAALILLSRGGGDPSTCAHPVVRADGPKVW